MTVVEFRDPIFISHIQVHLNMQDTNMVDIIGNGTYCNGLHDILVCHLVRSFLYIYDGLHTCPNRVKGFT